MILNELSIKTIHQIQPKFSLLVMIFGGESIILLCFLLLSATTSNIANPTNPAMMDTVPMYAR